MRSALEKTQPWLEAGLGIALGLVLYLPLGRHDLGEIAWIVASITGVARIGYTIEMRRALEPVRGLTSALGLRDGADERLRKLILLHDRINSPELQVLRDDILADSASRLEPLAHQLTSALLTPAEYYEWLTRMFARAVRGTRVCAVTTMLESEWDESAAEQRYLSENVAAAKRGVTVERLFVVPAARSDQFFHLNVAKAHSNNRNGLLGFFITFEALEALDAELLQTLGEGFVVFGARAALIDIMVPPGQARGQVTVNPDRIARMLRAFEQAKMHSSPVRA
jgi:hypothetical protein